MFDSLFSTSGLSLERLRTLCLIVEKGSITEAAGGDANTARSLQSADQGSGEILRIEAARQEREERSANFRRIGTSGKNESLFSLD